MPGTPALTDERWARVAPLLATPAGKRGRPPLEHRRALGGMPWVMRIGAAWREAPAEFGPWQTLYSRYTRWQGDGTWASHPGITGRGAARSVYYLIYSCTAGVSGDDERGGRGGAEGTEG